jgi:biotin operon repressor
MAAAPTKQRPKAEPYATVHASELAARAAPLSWLIPGLLMHGSANILGGTTKIGKSFVALDVCTAVASGTPWAGCFEVPAKAPVTLFAAEDPEAVVDFRLRALARARGFALAELPLEVIVEPVRLPEGIDRVAANLERSRPGLLLFDPLIRLHRADENSAAEMSVILDGLRSVAREFRTAVLLVHHTRKAPAGSSVGAALRGSSDLAAFGDSNLYLRQLSNDDTLELKIEHRAAARPPPVRIQLRTGEAGGQPTARFEILAQGESADPLADKILAVLAAAGGPVSSSALREQLGVRNQTITRVLQDLLAQGRVVRPDRNGWLLSKPTT